MYAALITHDVSDFDAFKVVFDEHLPARKEAGLGMHNLHVDADNPNRVVAFVSAPDLDTLQTFLADPALRAAMGRSGMIGAPEITLMENRGMDIVPTGTCGVLVRHPVADYEAFRTVFDAHLPQRVAAGMLGWSCNTHADDDTRIVVYVQADDLAKVHAFVDDPALKEAMGNAGVTGPPSFLFLEHVEMVHYN